MGSVWFKRILLAVAVVLAVVFLVQAVRFAPVPEVPQLEEPAAASLPLTATEVWQAPSYRWTVGVWQGRVAVFEGENTDPIRVMETPVSALPASDQKALRDGIPVDDPVVLAGILEDYSS
ncbi:MAG: hypothetical protein IKU58_02255 [Clostridia bacterium]|nr:hypothetical protein [Clostridia bacterium]